LYFVFIVISIVDYGTTLTLKGPMSEKAQDRVIRVVEVRVQRFVEGRLTPIGSWDVQVTRDDGSWITLPGFEENVTNKIRSSMQSCGLVSYSVDFYVRPRRASPEDPPYDQKESIQVYHPVCSQPILL
jgi:hypothetical protein